MSLPVQVQHCPLLELPPLVVLDVDPLEPPLDDPEEEDVATHVMFVLHDVP